MNRIKRGSTLILLTSVLVLSFQNCNVIGGDGFESVPIAGVTPYSPQTPDSLDDPTNGFIPPTPAPAPAPTPTPTPAPAPAPTPAPAPAPSTPPPPQPDEKVWIFKSDESRVQYIGQEISLDIHENQLKSSDIAIYARKKALVKNSIPTSFALKDTLHRVGNGSYNTPENPTYTGIHNGFQVKKTDVPKALSLGFKSSIGAHHFATSCEGKNTAFIFGQSNSANSGQSPDRQEIPGVYMFYNGFCYPAADPLLGATLANGGGSLWMSMAREYKKLHPQKDLVLFSFGVGGSSVREWTLGAAHFNRLSTALTQVRSSKLKVIKIFWHQGESDNLDQTSLNSYKNSLSSVITTLRANGLTAPISIGIVSSMSWRPYSVSRNVQNAQFELIENDSSIDLGLVSDFLPLSARASDGLHFSTSGQALAGNLWARLAFASLDKKTELIKAYYNIFLNRTAKAWEIQHWLSKQASGLSMKQIREEIQNSPEGFVRRLYTSFAKRIPEQDGFDFWMNRVTDYNRTDLENEFKNAIPQVVAQGHPDFDVVSGTLQPKMSIWTFNAATGFIEKK